MGRQADPWLGNTLVSIGAAETQGVLADMQQQGFAAPTMETYNPLVLALCRRGDYERAQALLVGGLEPDVITYATLIEYLCTHSRPAEALG